MARNFIDRCFEAVAPVHAVRRSAARTALQFLNSGYGNYGANLTKKSMRGWEYHGGSSKEDIEDNIDVLRQRSRDAYMGVPVAASALKTLRTNVVAGGLMPAPQIDGAFLGLSAEQTEELQEKIIREFSLWADTPECDMDGLGNFYKLQQLAYHYSDGGVGLRGDRGDRRGRNRGILSLLLRHRGGGRDRKAPGGRDDQPRKPGCGDGVRPVPDQRDDRGEDQAARYEGTDGGHYGGILAAQREGVIHGIRTSECSRRCRDGRRRGEAGRSGGQGSG